MKSEPLTVIPSTSRIEAYSDGVFAIIVTLLILELKVPALPQPTTLAGFLGAVAPLWPKFVSFVFSFFVLAIFWINHHAMYHNLVKSDAKLLWLNNLLLLFLTIVPFTTAFLGDNPLTPPVIALYAANLTLAAASFVAMGHWAMFWGNLMDPTIAESGRRREFRRGLVGVALYALAAGLAFMWPYLAWALLLTIPGFYVVPTILKRGYQQAEAPASSDGSA
jgi:uncharacterized membrane protein